MGKKKQEENIIDHPTHYTKGKYETIDVIEDWGLGYHLGNVIKYLSRHKHKGDSIQDLEKAQWYLSRYIKILKTNRGDNN